MCMTRSPQALLSSCLALLLVAFEPTVVLASTAPQTTPPSDPSTPRTSAESSPKTAPPKDTSVSPPSPDDKQETSAGGEASATPAKPDTAVPTTVEGALEGGDLTTARTLAVDHRRQHPDDPGAWRTEAKVHTELGDFESAIAAWQGVLKALPEDAEAERREAEAAITSLRLRARGTVADEPPSTHRGEFDRQRAAATATPPATTEPEQKVADAKPAPPSQKDRITSKWYFWVTLIAIAASAGAVTGIAVQAAMRDEDDALGVGNGAVGAGGPALFRF